MKRLDSVSTQISLLLRLKSGWDEQAWSEFVDRYREPIVGFCENVFAVDRDTAEDIAQDVLVKLLQQMRVFEYDAAKRFRNWMKTVAGNAVRDALRKRYRSIDRGAGTSDALAALEELPDPDRTARLAQMLTDAFHRGLLSEVEPVVERRVDEKTWSVYRLTSKGVPPQCIADQLTMQLAAVYQARTRVKGMLRQETKRLLPFRQPPEPV